VLTQLPGVVVQVPGDVVSLGPLPGCDTSEATCVTSTDYTFATGALVSEVKLRFLNGAVSASITPLFESYTYDSEGDFVRLALTATVTRNVIGSHVEWDPIPTAPIPAGDYIDVTFTYPSTGHNPIGPGFVYAYTPPFSTEIDFTNGTASRSGYDASGARPGFYSNQGAVFAFDPTAPGVVQGPSILPTSLTDISPITGLPVATDTDTSWSTPDVLAATQLPFQAFNAAEPASLLLLGTAVGGLMGMRRRNAARDGGGRSAMCPAHPAASIPTTALPEF